MNILPKKRWHVRTKDNIARVRRDEAEAVLQERKRIEKLEYAESEARLNLLRSKAGANVVPSASHLPDNASKANIIANDGHVDLFSDFQSHVKTVNKEHEKEKKEELEKYEKQIGYLTYLGQDTNEALKLRSWYEVAPDRTQPERGDAIERDLKIKHLNDPLTMIRTLLPEEKLRKKAVAIFEVRSAAPESREIHDPSRPKSKKSKKEKKHKKDKKKQRKKQSSGEEKHLLELIRKKELIERLRKERLKREARERARQEDLLCPKVYKPKPVENTRGTPRIVQKYNSQFNPELAKQNMA